MGIVVAATHLELGHRVAIKFLRDEMVGNPTVVDRFLREARAVVHLRTEHVCRVTDVGRMPDGAPYIVMELLEGVDLQRVVARQPLPSRPPSVRRPGVRGSRGGARCRHHPSRSQAGEPVRHAEGGRRAALKVLDFGIAKALAETGAQLTHTQGALGSPGYMSPEQLQSARDVDVRTDIWALGVTLYQLLSARLPFSGPTLPRDRDQGRERSAGTARHRSRPRRDRDALSRESPARAIPTSRRSPQSSRRSAIRPARRSSRRSTRLHAAARRPRSRRRSPRNPRARRSRPPRRPRPCHGDRGGDGRSWWAGSSSRAAPRSRSR